MIIKDIRSIPFHFMILVDNSIKNLLNVLFSARSIRNRKAFVNNINCKNDNNNKFIY